MSQNEEILNYIKRAFELKNQECYKQSIEMLYKALAIEPDNTELLYQIGELYYLLLNYPRAIQYAEKVLEVTPNHIETLTLLKNIYINQNEIASAKDTAEKIYSIDNSEKNLVDIVKLYGSIELAPLVGLSDGIVDIVETGDTMRQNNLIEVDSGETMLG